MINKINEMGEAELQLALNMEASTYRRKAIITRLHQRFTKLRSNREREGLVAGTLLL